MMPARTPSASLSLPKFWALRRLDEPLCYMDAFVFSYTFPRYLHVQHIVIHGVIPLDECCVMMSSRVTLHPAAGDGRPELV